LLLAVAPALVGLSLRWSAAFSQPGGPAVSAQARLQTWRAGFALLAALIYAAA